MDTRENHLGEAVLTSTLNLCFEQKYEKYQSFLYENFQFLVVKFSIYLNRRVFVMFVCVEVLRPSQPIGVMSSAVSLPNHTFTWQA